MLMLSVLGALLVGAPAGPASSRMNSLATGRDPYLWPFASDSIWNLPIGAGATYVPADVKRATGAGMTTDPDVLILTPTAPYTAVYQNNDGWSGSTRCNPQGGVLVSAPIPSDFVVPGAGAGNPDGTTPNYATAILMPDNQTLAQGQPMARCSPTGPATMMWSQENEGLYGFGFSGGHGGSGLSSIGGTIRLGELVPGGVIRHALKVNLYANDSYFYNASTQGYRWPATTADSYASSVYGGTVPALRMGSLLALSSSINITSMGLETQPALILARAFQDYGAYTVDDAGWSAYAIETEFSPNGRVEDQFQSAWGFSMRSNATDTPWARDMARIFGNLSVVDNWNEAEWSTVAGSNGTMGAGGGAPRVPWAPPLGSAPPPLVNEVSVTRPARGTRVTAGQSMAVSWSSSGALQSNSASVYFSPDAGATWGPPFATGLPLTGSTTWMAPNITTGQGLMRIVVRDVSGNRVEAYSALFDVEATPPSGYPVARLSYAPVWPRPGATVNFDASASSPSAPNETLEARWDWQDDGTWDTTWSTSLTAQYGYGLEGSFVVRMEVQDPSGHANNATVSLVVDATPPVTANSIYGTPGTDGWYVSNVTISLFATDALSRVASTQVRIDNGTWQAYAAPIPLRSGDHALEYYSMDAAGNTEMTHVEDVRVDTSHPVFGPVSPQGVVSSSTVHIAWRASDASSPVTFATSVDGGRFVDRGASTSLLLVLPDGDHRVVVRAIGVHGTLADAVITFRVDTNPFSFTGPYGGMPTIAILAAAIAVTATAGLLWRRREAKAEGEARTGSKR